MTISFMNMIALGFKIVGFICLSNQQQQRGRSYIEEELYTTVLQLKGGKRLGTGGVLWVQLGRFPSLISCPTISSLEKQ